MPANGRRKYDGSSCPHGTGDTLDALEELLERAGILREHTRHVGFLSCHRVTFLDLGYLCEASLVISRGNISRCCDAHHRRDFVSERGWVDSGNIAFDDSTAFELFDSVMDRGCCETGLSRELRKSGATLGQKCP